jgi:hypothetical protein
MFLFARIKNYRKRSVCPRFSLASEKFLSGLYLSARACLNAASSARIGRVVQQYREQKIEHRSLLVDCRP